MCHKKILSIMMGVILFAGYANALELRHTVTPHAGLSIPLAEYAQSTAAIESGYAELGFGGGVEYDMLFGGSGLSWSTGFAYLTNDYVVDFFSRGINIVVQESDSYSNYGFFTGLKYEKDFSESFRMFARAQGGYALSKGPYLNGFLDTEEDDIPYLEFQMGNDNAVGFSLGLGMVINETTTISLRYFNLGVHTYKGTVDYSQNDVQKSVDLQWDQSVSMVFLSIGYAIELGL